MDMLKESLNGVCRLCLTKVDDPSTMHTIEDEEADTVWSTTVRLFTFNKQMNSEFLPNKMCSCCAVWIIKVIHFELQCKVSERLLISLLKHHKSHPKTTAAFVRSLKSKLISLMWANSRDALALSEERWHELEAAIANPSAFRKSNWSLTVPPGAGVGSERCFSSKKQKQKKLSLSVNKEPESLSNVESRGEVAKPCDLRIEITNNNDTPKCNQSAIEVDSDSCNSWQPPPAKRRRIIYYDDDDDDDDDDVDREVEKLPVKVGQLKPYQLKPYMSLIKLRPEFFKPGCVYDLKDLKVTAMAQTLSMLVRKPGRVGKT